MNILEPSLAPVLNDELTQLQLSVAQRADELRQLERVCGEPRDYWGEAEAEILPVRFGERVAS